MAGSGVERAALGIFDARIVVERGFLGAAGIVDALFAGKRVDLGGIEIEIARKRSELRRLRNAAERIFGSDLGQLESGLQHAVESFAREVARIRTGGTLATKYPHANRAGAGLFQSLHLAEAHERGKFIALADYAFGGGGASGHGSADDVLGDVAEVGL